MNTISFGADPLCLSANEELAITYCCCCEIDIGISSEVDRDTTRGILFLRVKVGVNIVSFELVIF